MENGLVNFNWNEISGFSEEEITYFLSLEGKSVEAISKIRGFSKEEVQRHLIQGKIKYRFFVKSKDIKDLFENLSSLPKSDKLMLLQSLKEVMKERLIEFIKNEYMNMSTKYKETAIWVLGELRVENSLHILQKAVVHKHINIRRMAVSALGKIGNKASENALLRALEDENPQVVSYAIKALSKINSEKAYDKIENIYKITSKDYLKKAAEDFMDIYRKGGKL